MVCLLFMNRPDLSRNASLRATPEQTHGIPHAPRAASRKRDGSARAVFRVFAVCLPVPRAANAKPVFASYTIHGVLANAKTIAMPCGGD
jgi:hypothetical protein